MTSPAWGQAKGKGKPPAAAKAAAPVAAPKGDPVAGAEKADAERCVECHGTHGQGTHEARFARLAAQHPEYIIRQVGQFRTAARKNDAMAIAARAVSDEDLRDIAAFFASQPRFKGDGKPGTPAAVKLVTQGDAARGIPACVACHGADSRGQVQPGLLVPSLAGQEYQYLFNQFGEWRNGWRPDSPDGTMVRIAKALTEAEITELSQYFASLP
ncbi:MAG TPA: c-type cytochrome [Candidatus Aquabacterium excrementipullorum]|nr:c-type cytochrome [Candidatus Aquabacterium excrementipullorum]